MLSYHTLVSRDVLDFTYAACVGQPPQDVTVRVTLSRCAASRNITPFSCKIIKNTTGRDLKNMLLKNHLDQKAD